MKNLNIFASIITLILIACNTSQMLAQDKQYQIRSKALDIGVYDYSKVKKKLYKIYYEEEAEEKFSELLMVDERLLNSGIFGEYITFENDSIEFFREQEAYEYCPELAYVMITGGHGYVSAYDLNTLEQIFVNPSSYIYSPSRKYRFGTFEFDGIHYYLEVKENNKYIPYFLFSGSEGDMTGVYWIDDETIHYLKEKKRQDDSIYWIGYSAKFHKIDNNE